MNNFRGFADTYIPILKGNFLVGENSTGKTSVLTLLEIFSSNFLIHSKEYAKISHPRLGYFNDIVSESSENRDFFAVGRIHSKIVDNQEEITDAFLIFYKKQNGLPVIAMYIHAFGGKEYRIRVGSTKIKYKINSINLKYSADEFIENTYKNWTKSYETDTNEFEELPLKMTKHMSAIFAVLAYEHYKTRQDPNFLDKLIVPEFKVVSIAPIRSKPMRTYDKYETKFSSDGEHIPYLIKELFSSEEANSFKEYLSIIGKNSGLFELIETKTFGSKAMDPFELNVLLNGKSLNIKNVGYGVSQILPIIVELFSRSKKTWFSIQQPEVHLHPKAQATVGGVFYDAIIQKEHTLLVETHSDYIIDRFRSRIREKKFNSFRSQILFFERTNSGQNKVSIIPISEEGELSEDQPESYRNFFLHEELKNLGF